MERVKRALEQQQTRRGHLAQRVPHEGLGYCSHRSESPLCVDHRALVADVEAALSGDRRGD